MWWHRLVGHEQAWRAHSAPGLRGEPFHVLVVTCSCGKEWWK